MKRGALVGLMGLALIGCAMTTDDESESSADEINAEALRVTRGADGAFRIQSSIAARCAGCRDADRDGLNDEWEDAVLAKLTPLVTFDEDEPLMRKENHDAFAAVARVFPSPREGNRVVVSVMFLYGERLRRAEHPLHGREEACG